MKLYTATDVADAELLREQLESAGIAVRLKNEHLLPLAGGLPFTQVLPEIWLADERQTAAAQAIVTEYLERKRAPDDGPERLCPACGESSPSNFEVCWKCRRPF